MKAFNIIISIVVAVLAVVSAVFAFLMMQKNDVTQQGWKTLVAEINKTAQKLDQKSGKPIAGKLSEKTLGIDQAAQIGSKLNQLSARADEVVKERDAFADALCRIGNKVGASDVPGEEEMCALETYSTGKEKVCSAVNMAVNNRDKVYGEIYDVAKQQYGVKIDKDALCSGNTKAISPLVDAINKQANESRSYEAELGAVARLVKVDFKKDDVKGVSTGVRNALRTLEASKRQLERDLDSAKRSIREKENAVKESAAKVAAMQSEVAKRDQAIASYKRALGLAEAGAEQMPWGDGSIDARRAVVGKVVDVNEDYGYITIDLGSATTVEQKLGSKTLLVNPQLARGMEMIISRGAIGDKAEFVARVKLGEVGATCSTANIPAESEDIKEGDFVYVSL